MKQIIHFYRRVELFFGSLKFAVVIITLFALALTYGTFMESYHGADYANRLVYKSLWFMGIQLAMFLSILFATLLRLPPKKHLYGFYVIHLGLIVLFLGSFITYQSGVDGSITLRPNLPSREIQVNEDELKIQLPTKGKEVSVALPYTALKKDLGYEYEGIKLKTYLPFSELQEKWIPLKSQDENQSSSKYHLYNENFGEFLTLSLHPYADFSNTQKLGPLNVHYMPSSLVPCFTRPTNHGLIIWNGENSLCEAPLEEEMKKTKNLSGQEVVEVNFKGVLLRFLPALSPLPLNQEMNLNEASPYRIFSKKLFEKGPHLFLFGKTVVFFDKSTGRWVSHPSSSEQEVSLPWMGFKIKVIEHRSDAYPSMVPHYTKPIHENGALIQGKIKALEVEMNGQTFWINSSTPLAYNMGSERVTFDLGKKNLILPYELVLDRFKMDTDPGTNNPASYESFVTLFKGNQGSTKHHVYMNHPLKHQNFTFYQASYFQTEEGPYGSVFSVNFDPGRFWKYLGSLLLVLGSIWHFVLRQKKVKPTGEISA